MASHRVPSTEAPRGASRASVCGAFGARMADDEPAPGVTPSDGSVARRRDVAAAIAALEHSLGGRGATFLKHARTWEASLDHAASKLKKFPTGLRGAGDRLPASPPDLRAAQVASEH